MNITKEQIDDLNVIVKIAIHKEDYQDKVEKTLKSYKKQANIPGFRKGQVPLGLIKRQYGTAVVAEEVNQLLQETLDKYLSQEKLEILGAPLLKHQEKFDWESEVLDFQFELGLKPNFEIKLTTKKATPYYKIVADKKSIDEQVEDLRKEYGKILPKEEVGKSDEVTGSFIHEEENINQTATLNLNEVHKKSREALLGKKVGETISLASKTLFKEPKQLAQVLEITQEKAEKLDVEIPFTIEEIYERELAPLDQELFDKCYEKDQVKSEKDLRKRLQEDYEAQFKQLCDQKFLNDLTEKLIEETKFDLPSAFLQKWIQFNEKEKEPVSEEEARETFEKSEKNIRYQLIKQKILKEHQIQIEFEEIKNNAKASVIKLFNSFSQIEPEEEKIENFTNIILQDEKHVEQLSQKLINEKLLALYKEKANLKTKEITYDDFTKET